MKQLLLAIMLIPFIGESQERGIHFERGLSWEQVKAKANIENKYIFVDCFATWCGPCKAMDLNVYPNDAVGNYMNAKFISIKVQMDTSKNDNEEIKAWYSDAHVIQQENKVFAMPTYLFYSPEGNILHKDIGAKNIKEFIALATDAQNQDKQYIRLVDEYQSGKLSYSKMSQLAKMARDFKENKLASDIAANYMHNYLDKMSEDSFLTKPNLNFMFIYSGMVGSKDRIFKLCYYEGEKIDAITGLKGQAKSMIDYIIWKEEISPFAKVEKGESSNKSIPDWKMIIKVIRNKYNADYADRNVLNAQINWYGQKKMWEQCIQYQIKKVEKYGLDTANLFGTYNMLTTIYEHSKDKHDLTKALNWMRIFSDHYQAIGDRRYIGSWDTYAGLLYRTGHREEGIRTMEKYIELTGDKDVNDTFEKMKRGEEIMSKR